MKTKNAFKTLSIILTCLLSMNKIYAQDSIRTAQPAEVRSLNKIRLTLLGASYEREQKIGKTATVYAGGGLAGTFLIEYSFDTRDGQDTKTYFDITPNVYAGIRKYYNFNQRIKKGKKIANNSANYFGLDAAAYFKPLLKNIVTNNWELGITPQWGFQRSVGKKVNFELMLGPTVRLNDIETYYGVDGRIGFSFIL